jgi:DNA repair protein RadC
MKIYNPKTILCQEESIVLYLNRANKIIGVQKLSKGGIAATVIDTRLILSTALKSLSSGIIISHNHPSGNKIPSDLDLMLTSKLRQACELLDIKLLDHIIVTRDNGFYSLADNLQL